MNKKRAYRAFALMIGCLIAAPAALGAQQNPALIAEGAQVFAANCGRCHNARPGAERTDREWVVIVAHMRARANMAKSKADAVLAFLQATNVPEGNTAVAAPPPEPESRPAPDNEGRDDVKRRDRR